MKKEKIGLIIGSVLIVFAFIYTVIFVVQQSNEEKISESLVEEFKTQLNLQNNVDPSFGTTYLYDDDDIEEDSDVSEVSNQQTIGIMEIPSKHATFPVALSSAYDTEQTETLLKTHAVLYSDFGEVGMMGQNAVFSAHSSINNVGCGHCYFNHIEEMKEGDTFAYTDQSGITYTYEVFMVSSYNSKDDTWFYESPTEDDQSWATLVTCSYGDGQWRSVVCGKLIDITSFN